MSTESINKVNIVGMVLAGLAALIGIGALPKLNDLQTKSEAREEAKNQLHRIEAVRQDARANDDQMLKALEAAQVEMRAQREATEKRLETIDGRTWVILQELRRQK